MHIHYAYKTLPIHACNYYPAMHVQNTSYRCRNNNSRVAVMLSLREGVRINAYTVYSTCWTCVPSAERCNFRANATIIITCMLFTT